VALGVPAVDRLQTRGFERRTAFRGLCEYADHRYEKIVSGLVSRSLHLFRKRAATTGETGGIADRSGNALGHQAHQGVHDIDKRFVDLGQRFKRWASVFLRRLRVTALGCKLIAVGFFDRDL
jgi:hypothetical protein